MYALLKETITLILIAHLILFNNFQLYVYAEETDFQAEEISQLKEKTDYCYKLLRANKLITKKQMKYIVQKNKYLDMLLFLFAYEDAANRNDIIEETKLTKGLKSYKKGNTKVSIEDAVKLALRISQLSFNDEVALKYIDVLRDDAIIPQQKRNTDFFSYKVAIDILEEIRKERNEKFEKSIPSKIELTDLFGQPRPKINSKFSPDGKYEAYLAEWNDMYNVFAKNLKTDDTVRVSSCSSTDVNDIYWVNDKLFYSKDNGGDECYHIYSTNFNNQTEKDITPNADKSYQYVGYQSLKNGEFYIFIRYYNPINHEFIYYAINSEDNEWSILPRDGGLWAFHNISIPNNPKYYIKITDEFNNGENAIVYKVTKKTFEEEEIFRVEKNKQFIGKFFNQDGTILYGLSNNTSDTLCPVALDIEDGTMQILYKDEKYDVLQALSTDVICNFGQSEPQVIQYYAKKFESVGLNKKVKKALKNIKEKLNYRQIQVLNISSDFNNYVVQKVTPFGCGNKYSYALNADVLKCIETKKENTEIVELDACMKPISFFSRDKLKIEGYLTLPIGKTPENLPTIVNVHGGPWSRYKWRRDLDTEFLASGYAVLQINFRGSTGYGRKFLDAGDNQWGKKIQNDISDGVKWLINKGVADPKRLCIYGGSFGGYSALCGVTLTPDLYVCGVSQCGFSSAVTFLENIPDDWQSRSKQLYYHVGHPKIDKVRLNEVSPINHLGNVVCPLLIVQGANDSRVKRYESDKVINTLRSNGQNVTYIVRENEGHGFRKKQNILDFYTIMEKFLKKHLKPNKITTRD